MASTTGINTMKGFFRSSHFPLFVWFGIMVILNSLPGNALPETASPFHLDKIAHFVEYYVFGLLLLRSLHLLVPSTPTLLHIVATVAVGIGIGGFDELHQLFIPNRECTPADFLTDTIGILTALCTHRFVFRIIRLNDYRFDRSR